MNKKSQICNASEAIQGLCGLISAFHMDKNYTTEQGAKYYKEIFQRNMLKKGENEVISNPPYIIHVCMIISELAKFVCTMELREEITEEQIVKNLNLISEILRIDEGEE